MGASVGIVNTPLAYCTATNMAPTTKANWAGRTMRVSSIVLDT